MRRAHLSDNALHLVRQRIVVISLLAWLPLAILTVFAGQAFDGVAVPFVRDIEVHVRFLLTMPLLIAAELLVNQRMRPLLKQFLERRLIPPQALPRFDAAIASALRLRNSVAAEVTLLVLVYTFGVFFVWRQYAALDRDFTQFPHRDTGIARCMPELSSKRRETFNVSGVRRRGRLLGQ